MKRNIQSYFLYFLLYEILGWLYEVFLEVVIYRWGYSDRGFCLVHTALYTAWAPWYFSCALAA